MVDKVFPEDWHNCCPSLSTAPFKASAPAPQCLIVFIACVVMLQASLLRETCILFFSWLLFRWKVHRVPTEEDCFVGLIGHSTGNITCEEAAQLLTSVLFFQPPSGETSVVFWLFTQLTGYLLFPWTVAFVGFCKLQNLTKTDVKMV